MSSLEVYRETTWWKLMLLLIAVVAVPITASIWYASGASPEEQVAVPVLIFVLAVVSAVIVGFSRFTVVLTNSGISAGFGFSKGRFRWGEVEACYLDEASAMRYGGYGIKAGVFNGRTRLVYNITGAKRVVLKVKGRKYDEFVFSTRNPEQVMRIIRMQTGQPP